MNGNPRRWDRTKLIPVLTILSMLQFSGCCTLRPKVEYVRQRSDTELVKPVDTPEVCKVTRAILGLTNGLSARETIVAWAVKKSESDRPPVLAEEVVLHFQLRDAQTNIWVLACVQRCAGRGRPGTDDWSETCYGRGMEWVRVMPKQPSTEDLTRQGL